MLVNFIYDLITIYLYKNIFFNNIGYAYINVTLIYSYKLQS